MCFRRITQRAPLRAGELSARPKGGMTEGGLFRGLMFANDPLRPATPPTSP